MSESIYSPEARGLGGLYEKAYERQGKLFSEYENRGKFVKTNGTPRMIIQALRPFRRAMQVYTENIKDGSEN